MAYLQKTLVVLWLLSFSYLASAAPTFPTLTGPVVDEVSLLDSGSQSQLAALLKQHEQATGNQVVVAVIKDLQGYEIKDYGYQLGRHWGIGQKGKDNGALLIIAPKERKVAIEVGYGLEGQLTDVISHNIIQTKITPAFRQDQYAQGIIAGTVSMIDALGGQYKVVKTKQRRQSREGNKWVSLLMFLIFGLQFIGGSRRGGRRGFGRGLFIGGMAGMGSSGGFGGGSGFGGGGFSGGGGSFGGGGASGGW